LPPYRNASKTIDERVDDLMSRMTLDEKVGQLSQDVIRVADPQAYAERIRSGAVGSYILGLGSDDPCDAQRAAGIRRQRVRPVPIIFGFDTIHDLRTVFPIPLAVSCAWDQGFF
jgi:beta-glucosidase